MGGRNLRRNKLSCKINSKHGRYATEQRRIQREKENKRDEESARDEEDGRGRGGGGQVCIRKGRRE